MLIKDRFIPGSFDVITEFFVIKADTAMKIRKQREKDDGQPGIFGQWSNWDLFISIEEKRRGRIEQLKKEGSLAEKAVSWKEQL